MLGKRWAVTQHPSFEKFARIKKDHRTCPNLKWSPTEAMTIHRAIPAVIAIIWITGCYFMVSTKEELQNLSENEGVVIGSVLLTVEQRPESESGWAFLHVKSGELSYRVPIQKAGFIFFPTIYRLFAMPGDEKIFIKNLPAGSYEITNVQANLPFNLPGQYLVKDVPPTDRVSVSFEVKPRQTSYIGKIALTLPYYLQGSVRVVGILDTQNETVEKLRNEHTSILGNTVKDLATLRN